MVKEEVIRIKGMAKYSIRELEKLSGIKAHTIRIWEKRYRILSPHRTTTNIRSYSDDDLKMIINISLLNGNGIKISKIAGLSSAEIAERVTRLSAKQNSTQIHIDRLVVAMIDLEEENFEAILSDFIHSQGLEKTIVDIVYPFLQKIGILWQTGNISPAQEHFISNLIRQKFIVAIDALPLAPKKTSRRALLFLPEGELHELGLLFCHYMVKKSGIRTYYLGQQVPMADVNAICESHQPELLLTAITTSPARTFVEDYLKRLSKAHLGRTILVTGNVLDKIALKFPPNLHIFSNPAELKALLKSN